MEWTKDIDLILRIVSVLVLPALGALVYHYRRITKIEKMLEFSERRFQSIEDKIESLPGHKLYNELKELIALMDKNGAVANEKLIGVLNGHQAENKAQFNSVNDNIKDLKESRIRHDQMLKARGS